ncbi:uncharacterized protein LOC113471328 [Diaphorina citri]|uniref:Uncharacterized protein LOC113471328 n=1 Tax=Diaphorina citri TaxID=121845 RepID=A0A3Q0JCH2_DIACI|nr:uncharacterized protein LOC113471328 [Diaphorina citri]
MVLAAFAVASFCAFCGHVLATETLIIPQGRIRGTVRQSRDSNPYYAFLGIPYALPPVEDLRFKVKFSSISESTPGIFFSIAENTPSV